MAVAVWPRLAELLVVGLVGLDEVQLPFHRQAEDFLQSAVSSKTANADTMSACSLYAESISNFASLLSGALTSGLEKQTSKLPRVRYCSVPSLMIKQKKTGFFPSNSKPLLENAAASNLSSPVEIAPHRLDALPLNLLWNLSKSFLYLVDSRLRFSMKALAQRGDSRLLFALLSADPVQPTTIVTTFRTLAFCEATDEGYVLPLVLEVVLDLTILGNLHTVRVEAPGTIEGTFVGGDSILDSVQVQLDTGALLQSMMKVAREAVRHAVSEAITIVSHVLHDKTEQALYEDRKRPAEPRSESVDVLLALQLQAAATKTEDSRIPHAVASTHIERQESTGSTATHEAAIPAVENMSNLDRLSFFASALCDMQQQQEDSNNKKRRRIEPV